MSGKVMIVTGASSGIGLEVARYLCEGGNDVILACRNEEKANRAIEKIRRNNPNALATFMKLDLTDLDSIRAFVEEFKKLDKSLHGLVNNAGVSLTAKVVYSAVLQSVAAFLQDTKRQYCDGSNFELTMGTNHLGPFLLTNLLLDELKKQEDARIVNVTSSIHDPDTMKRKPNLQALDLEDLFLFKDGVYNGLQAYKNSKTANVMFTAELAKQLEGSNVTCNSVCPGFVPATELARSSSKAQKFFHRYILGGALRFTKITKTPQQGAQAICNLLTDEKYKGVTGKYYKDGVETDPSEESRDAEKQEKLWKMSGGYVALDGFDKIDVERPPEPEPEPPKEEKKDEEKKEGEKEEKKDEAAEGEEKKDEEKKEVPDEEAVKEGEKEPEDKPEITDEPKKEEEQPKEEIKEDKPVEVKEEEKKEETPAAEPDKVENAAEEKKE